jgi:hypothetical protein
MMVTKLTMRKVFHVLAIIIFSYSAIHNPPFLITCFSGALGLFVIIELCRINLKDRNIWLVDQANTYCLRLIDKKDSVHLILTHVYLLIGFLWPTVDYLMYKDIKRWKHTGKT